MSSSQESLPQPEDPHSAYYQRAAQEVEEALEALTVELGFTIDFDAPREQPEVSHGDTLDPAVQAERKDLSLEDLVTAELTYNPDGVDIASEVVKHLEDRERVHKALLDRMGTDNLAVAVFRFRLRKACTDDMRKEVTKAFRENPTSLQLTYEEYTELAALIK